MSRAAVPATIGLLLLLAGPAAARPWVRRSAPPPPALVDLDFVRADIHNVLRFLSQIGGVDIVVADDVRGTVTLRLRRVRWQAALTMILRSQGLEAERSGRRLLLVAPATTLARQREARLVRRRDCLATAPLVTRIVRLNYAQADKIAPHLRAALRSRRGSVAVDQRTNALIIRDVEGCR